MSAHYRTPYDQARDPRTKRRTSDTARDWVNKLPTTRSAQEDSEAVNTYGYEYTSQVNMKSQRKRDVISEYPEKSFANRVRGASYGGEATRRRNERIDQAQSRSFAVPEEDMPYLNEAATKIQATYRGYKTRKSFWKEREHVRRQTDAQRFRTESRDEGEDRVATPASRNFPDSRKGFGLDVSTDPNLGILPELKRIDSETKLRLSKEWRTKVPLDNTVPVSPTLQDEQTSVVLLIGGINPLKPDDFEIGASVFVYNTEKDKWFFGGYMPEPRNYHAAVFSHGKVFVTGGYSQFNVQHGEMVATRTVFQLSPRSKRWRRRTDMHYCRACHGICAINLSVFVVGGRSDNGQLLSTVEVYDTQNDQWSVIRSLPEPLMGMAVTTLDEAIFVIGGLAKEEYSSSYTVSDKVYFYERNHSSWYGRLSLPEPLAFCSAVTVKREIWVWGGVEKTLSPDGSLRSSDSVYVYLRNENRWDPRMKMQTPKHSVAMTKTVGRKIFLMGGMSSQAKEALIENDIYDRENDNLVEGAALPKPLTGTAAVGLPPDKSKQLLSRLVPVGAKPPEGMKEVAATRIQAVVRGYLTRSALFKKHQQQLYSTPVREMDGDYNSWKTYNKYHMTSFGENKLEDDFRKFNTTALQAWPPTPNPTSSKSCINLTLGSQYPGYTITRDDERLKIKRYVCLSPDIDPNIGLIPYLDDLYKKTRIAVGLRHIDQTPFYSVELKNIDSLRDDSVPMVLLIGGVSARDPLNIPLGKAVLKYHPLKDRFYYCGLLPEARNHHAAAYLEEKVYVSGGCDPDFRNSGEMVSTRSTFCLNFSTGDWVRKSPMHCPRAFHSLVAYTQKLYAIGGRDNNGRIVASIESYDPEMDQWTLCRPMPSARMGLSCVVFENRIWCMGGIGTSSDDGAGSGLRPLQTVSSYDPVTNQWIHRPPLRCPRAFGGAVVVDKKMWLIGGCCRVPGQKNLVSMASVDCYDPNEAEWERRTVIANPRHCACIVAVESCIYVFGGVCSQEWSDLDRNEMVITFDLGVDNLRSLPAPVTGAAGIVIPPFRPTLRAESLASLVHNKLIS